jgi:uroporphyrin-III C-methyltransferase
MDALAEHGIACHICPGITAASAAAASAGISLTLRGLARKLIFVTAHAKAGEELDLDWQTLADPKATLAVYMGKAAAATISSQLLKAGLAADTPVLLIENASLPDERQFRTRLDLLALSAKSALGAGPALMLIGEAVRQRRAPGATNILPTLKRISVHH